MQTELIDITNLFDEKEIESINSLRKYWREKFERAIPHPLTDVQIVGTSVSKDGKLNIEYRLLKLTD